jgi:phosphomethylpyrimidine synthase
MKSNYMQISYPASRKIYIRGKIHDIKVGMRQISLLDTISVENGIRREEKNDPVVVYDTSGAYSDDSGAPVDIRKGLPRLREPWIKQRHDTEKLPSFSSACCRERPADTTIAANAATGGERNDSRSDAIRFPQTNLPRRAAKGKNITQMY